VHRRHLAPITPSSPHPSAILHMWCLNAMHAIVLLLLLYMCRNWLEAPLSEAVRVSNMDGTLLHAATLYCTHLHRAARSSSPACNCITAHARAVCRMQPLVVTAVSYAQQQR
jgi:hypothetical protein